MTVRKMKVDTVAPLINVFSKLPDPRSAKSRRHPLLNVIVIAVCGVICGADGWVGIEAWGKTKQQWLGTFLDMSAGVPSHDTLGRVFSILSPIAFQAAFSEWVNGLEISVDGLVVAIDGKTLRRSHDRSNDRSAIHVVNAWCTSAGVSLGQVKTADKSNEITAIPELLDLLTLSGAIVTTDAMGCQKEIAAKVRERGGNYLLAVKNNHPKLMAEIQERFDSVLGKEVRIKALLTTTTTERGHGREETRNTYVLPAPIRLYGRAEWRDIASIVMVEGTRTIDEKTTSHQRFYISSLSPKKPRRFHNAVRAHWGVENGLHWVLDIAFREDESRIRMGHAAENMARLRQIALNLLKQEKTAKVGIKNKRLRAGWDEGYLRRVLAFRRVEAPSDHAHGTT